MKTRAPSFSASEVRFALASYCKCLTSHLPRCALVHAHIGQPHASHAARNTCTSPDTCAETALGILALARRALPLKMHTYEHTHMHHTLSRTAFLSSKSNPKRHTTSFA